MEQSHIDLRDDIVFDPPRDSHDELRLYTQDVLSTIRQHNDTISPVINILRDEVENTSTVYPHTSDPPIDDPTLSSSLTYTDRPPDALDLQAMYESCILTAGTQGVVSKLNHEVECLIHHDSGANRSVTRHRHLVHSITPIQPLKIKGANEGSGFLSCSEKGFFDLLCDDGSFISVPIYVTNDGEGTILSPTDICLHHYDKYSAWKQYSDIGSNTGKLTFFSKHPCNSATISLVMRNGLWYSTQSTRNNRLTSSTKAYIKTMTAEAEYELWHQRLCHPGQKIMESISHSAKNVPNLKHKRHEFYHCDTCSHAKIHKKPRNKSISTKTTSRGERFHMDYGFVRGDDFHIKNKKLNRFITSIDGFNSYLIIVDAHTRYTWVYLTSTKEPPVDLVKQFLDDHGLERGPRYIRTDQGGELYTCKRFRKVVSKCGYTVEPTGSDDSSQNGVAERPNRTYGNMMRAILSNSQLDSKFWSFALRHSVYVKNRLPHAHYDYLASPFEAYTGRKPDLLNLRIFGCPVRVRKPGFRSSKLSNHTYPGRFLEFVGTDKNIRYYDTKTKRVKIASHVVFDETQYSIKDKSPGALALYNAGLANVNKQLHREINHEITVNFTKLSENAKTPEKATDGSVGSDLYSAQSMEIPAHSLVLVNTDLAVECPSGTYGRIAPRSGLTVKNNLTVFAGVIDNDYRGNVRVALYNFGDKPQSISKGDKIAQIIFEQIKYPTFYEKNKLPTTGRGDSGFGSSDQPKIAKIQHQQKQSIELCSNSNGPTVKISIAVKGKHKTLGLVVDDQSYINCITLLHCQKGTPSARIPKWRSTLRKAKILSVDGNPISTKKDLEKVVAMAFTNKSKSITMEFQTSVPTPINPTTGIPTIYHDQLQHITNILETINSPTDILISPYGAKITNKSEQPLNFENFDDEVDNPATLIPDKHILQAIIRHVQQLQDTDKSIKKKKKLTRKYLKSLSNWDEWQNAEKKQLDLYAKQHMFLAPVARPKNANVLNLLWAYRIKDDNTLKARCVCNGNPRRKGTVTLDHTYAACLAQTGARIFWALSAVEGLIVTGADASNAFAEAPPPKAPLFVYADEQYREWWVQQGNDPIPKNFVLPVNHALQGHPESPRLWSKLIDGIIRNHVGLVPTTHEPCLYSGEIDGTKVYLLRQVDDFAVASNDIEVNNKVISKISEKLSVPMHNLGIISRFNGVDISQTQEYVKISNETYISKVLENYNWTEKENKISTNPLPLKDDSAFLARLDNDVGPDPSTNKPEYISLEERMGFKYRKLLGELLFCMVTCRPDISFPVIKLAKFANRPGEIHYIALKGVLRYLRATITDGIYYWREHSAYQNLLPLHPAPKLFHTQNPHLAQDKQYLLGFMDADWGHDVQTRKSVTGIAMFFGGAVIYYKTKYQTTIAQSSTEAEFMSACDAGKISLYLRSILDELQIDQNKATILFEDNQGALLMGNAGMPTRRTRHMDIKYFSLQQWIEQDLILLQDIESTYNVADTFTKQLGRVLFHQHNDTVMGRKYPIYYKGKYSIRSDPSSDIVSEVDST